MKKLFKFLPVYGIIPILSLVAVQVLCYLGSAVINADLPKHDLTTVFDLLVPFSPGWIFIYWGWMFFLAYFFIVADIYSKRAVYRLVSVCITSYCLIFIFYLAYPTTNIRLPEYSAEGAMGYFVNLLYGMDRPSNLLPSIHVFASWMCWVAIRRESNVPLWIRIFALDAAILICIATQVVKQHYVIDIFASIALAEVMNLLVTRIFRVDKQFERFFTYINVKLRLEPVEIYHKFRREKENNNKS